MRRKGNEERGNANCGGKEKERNEQKGNRK